MKQLIIIVIGVSFFHFAAFAEFTSKITFPELNEDSSIRIKKLS